MPQHISGASQANSESWSHVQALATFNSKPQNFDAQIADTTIAMIQYIMLTYYKRFRDYETIGGLFADVKKFITEYNLAEKIWILVCEILKSFAEMFEIPINKIMKKLFDNPQFEKTIFKFINDDYNEKVIDNQNIKTINNAI